MTDIAIRVNNLSKCYQIYDTPRDRLKQFVVPQLCRAIPALHKLFPTPHSPLSTDQGTPTPHSQLTTYHSPVFYKEFWALNDVSFEVKKGESFAIIGRNGSGKSTLLQMICGTLNPTGGSVQTNGRIAALLELGSGFNHDFTGRENIYLNGSVLGLTHEEIEARLEDILAFADIGDFIDQPVKTYSSGMFVRLAFAVQVNVDPEIFIVDEALSVGDFFFQQKCFARLRKMREDGLTLLFVSHDMGTVRDLCPSSIYLAKGKTAFLGDSQEAIRMYLSEGVVAAPAASLALATTEALPMPAVNMSEMLDKTLWRNESQTLDAEGKLLAVSVCDKTGAAEVTFRIGDTVTIAVAYVSKLLSACHAGVTFLNKYNQRVTVMGSYFSKVLLPSREFDSDEFEIVVCELQVALFLEAGQYSLDVSVGRTTEVNRGVIMDAAPPIGPLTISWDYEHEVAPFLGQVGLPVDCRCYLAGK